MYNGIGLTTPRGSGTSGHVQRNWALVRKKEKTTQKDDKKLEQIHKKPNQEILDHAKKRKVEVKCAELADILEDQGLAEEEIETRVNNYRQLLLKNDKKAAKILEEDTDTVISETHHQAKANIEKNERLKSAFGISDNFVEGSSFDPDKRAKDAEKNAENEKTYAMVRTPSPANEEEEKKSDKKHKRKRSHSESRKKKSKKHKKDGKRDKDRDKDKDRHSRRNK